MVNIMKKSMFTWHFKKNHTIEKVKFVENISQAALNTSYTITSIKADDASLSEFLFTLGCYEGESITLISKLAENYVISIKDARYSIDQQLAEAIKVA